MTAPWALLAGRVRQTLPSFPRIRRMRARVGRNEMKPEARDRFLFGKISSHRSLAGQQAPCGQESRHRRYAAKMRDYPRYLDDARDGWGYHRANSLSYGDRAKVTTIKTSTPLWIIIRSPMHKEDEHRACSGVVEVVQEGPFTRRWWDRFCTGTATSFRIRWRLQRKR